MQSCFIISYFLFYLYIFYVYKTVVFIHLFLCIFGTPQNETEIRRCHGREIIDSGIVYHLFDGFRDNTRDHFSYYAHFTSP